MANPGYVRSTDGSNGDNGSTWALANATLGGAMADQSAGDRIWISQSHAETSASNTTITCPGSLASPCQMLCGNDAAEPPTALASTATITTTSTADLFVDGNFYCYGVSFFSNHYIWLSGGTAPQIQQFDNCAFRLTGSSGEFIWLSNGGFQDNGIIRWTNCNVRFGATGQGIFATGRMEWIGGSVLSGGTSPTNLFLNGAFRTYQGKFLISGVDLSNLGTSTNLFLAGDQQVDGVIRNCKLPASWNGVLISGTQTAGSRYAMYNCDSGDTNYRLWVEDFSGSIKSETTIIRTGGANDGTTGLSWKMVTAANAEYPVIHLESPEIVIWNETTGSSVSVTAEIVHDSAGAGSGSKFQDNEIWIDVQYLGTSGYPLGTVITDCKADVLASAANQTDSTETWTTTGLTTPVKQKLSVSFTPRKKGFIHAKIVMAKASKTCYVCPKIAVA